MWRRTTFILVAVAVFSILESNICFSLTSDLSRNTGKARDAQLSNHQTKSPESLDDTELLAKRQFRRGVVDQLDELKDTAKKANSVYKWLKKHWQKLAVIVVAVFALIFVVGIYRRCFSDSSSSGDDEEPNIVVVTMMKPDNKGKEAMDATVVEGGTQGSGNTGHKGNTDGRGATDTGHTGCTDRLTTGGKVYKETSSSLVTTNLKEHNTEREVVRAQCAGSPVIASKSNLNDFYIPTNSIPISGYTTFQQIDCYKIYFFFNQYLIFSIKTMSDQLKDRPSRVCQGSTSEGPFPFYEEMPLIKNLTAYLMLKHFDDYVPTASTNTNLPLTVSP